MANNKKVSIILIHYNQPLYVKKALESIFNQTYKNIEVIFADDASSEIDPDELKEFTKENNKNNFEVIWQLNKENQGTVKNINQAVKKSTGDYILIFAADDKLYDTKVVEKFVKAYENADDDVALIFGQCYMMDEDLEKVLEKFINPSEALRFNSLSSYEQFKILTTSCFVAMGASMLKKSILEKHGLFNENYKFIEDWPYFMEITKEGYKLKYENISCLLHRDGGISHSTKVTPTRLKFWQELVKMTEVIVFPEFKNLNKTEKYDLLEQYTNNKNALIERGAEYDKKGFNQLIKNNFGFFLSYKIKNYNKNSRELIKYYGEKLGVVGVLIILLIELNNLTNNNFKYIFYILMTITGLMFLKRLAVCLIVMFSKLLCKLKIVK